MFRKYFYAAVGVLLFSLPALTSVENSSSLTTSVHYSQPTPFIRLQNLFFKGDTQFSFSLSNENWYSGRCFLPYTNNPVASLLVLLPNDFYADEAGRGPLFPGHARMWMLGSGTNNANEFDILGPKKEKKITQLLKTQSIPIVKRESHALVSRWAKKGAGLALRHFDTYLIVQKFSLYNTVATEYCYYFNKVK